jgi:hypothetical protein
MSRANRRLMMDVGIEKVIGSLLTHLDKRFSPIEEAMAKFPAIAEESEAKTAYENMADSFLASLKAEIQGAYESVARQLKENQEHLSEVYAHYSRLMFQQRNLEMNDGDRNTSYYWIVYLTLVLGSIVVFAWNFSIIMPEQKLWMAIIQSIVMAGPSFFISQAYIRSRSKDTFLRRLHIIGIASSVTMVLAAAIGRGTAYYLLNNSGGGSIITQQDSTWIDTLHFVASALTFVACIAVDIAFSGRLMIIISQSTEMKHISKDLVSNIAACERKITYMESESAGLSQKIGWEKVFDAVANPWKEAKLQEQLMAHKARHQKVRDDAMGKLRSLPTIELVKRAS